MTNKKRKTILDFPIEAGDFSRGGEASSNLKDTLRKLGISAKIIRKIAIATYELEINVIIHTEGGKLQADISEDEIRILASDNGPGIEDVDQVFQPGYSTASEKARQMGFGAGMGLCNIKRYSDDINVETEMGKGTDIETIVYLK